MLVIFQQNAFKKLLVCLVGSLLIFTSCNQKAGNTTPADDTDPGQLARQYMAKNQFDEAEASFKKAIQVTPGNILNYGSLARLYVLKNNYGDAENEVNDGLKIDANNEELRLLLTTIYIHKGDKEKAVAELKAIIDKNPKSGRAWYKLADIGPQNNAESWEKNCLLKSLSFIPAIS